MRPSENGRADDLPGTDVDELVEIAIAKRHRDGADALPAVLLVQGDRRLEVRGNVENRRESSDVARFRSDLEELSSGPRSPVRRRDEEPGYDAERLRGLVEYLAGVGHYLHRRHPIEGDVSDDVPIHLGDPRVDRIRTSDELPQLLRKMRRVAVNRSHYCRQRLAAVEV